MHHDLTADDHKLSMSFPDSHYSFIESMSMDKHITKAQIMRMAVGLLMRYEAARERGHPIAEITDEGRVELDLVY